MTQIEGNLWDMIPLTVVYLKTADLSNFESI